MSVPKLNLGKISTAGGDSKKESSRKKGKDDKGSSRTPGLPGLKLAITPKPVGSIGLGGPAGAGEEDAPLENSRYRVRAFDTVCSKITDDLFLGSDTVARDKELLLSNGITHILNCAGDVCGEYHPDQFVYKTLCLKDVGEEDISQHFVAVCRFVHTAITRQRGRVFVHCQKGVSRSSAMTIAYLMFRDGLDFDAAHNYIKAIRDVANPNPGFIVQLLEWGKQLRAGLAVMDG